LAPVQAAPGSVLVARKETPQHSSRAEFRVMPIHHCQRQGIRFRSAQGVRRWQRCRLTRLRSSPACKDMGRTERRKTWAGLARAQFVWFLSVMGCFVGPYTGSCRAAPDTDGSTTPTVGEARGGPGGGARQRRVTVEESGTPPSLVTSSDQVCPRLLPPPHPP
jgi:hypothetical protein